MEPITHLMTGACLARAGFNRKAAYATVAMVVAAELPDADVLWGIAGPVAAFQHHRGWTHTFVGMPVEAAAVVGTVWLWHRWRLRRKSIGVAQTPALRGADGDFGADLTGADAVPGVDVRRGVDATGGPGAAPVRWGLLFLFTLAAVGSHLLLDWTNNYGLRPFFPFNGRWYAGSIVFIVEPVLFAMLAVALVAPALFGLIGSEVGARRARFRGRGWAIAALVGMVGLWGWRAVEKGKALEIVAAEGVGGDGPSGVNPQSGDSGGAAAGAGGAGGAGEGASGSSGDDQVLRVGVGPRWITPFKWHVVVETRRAYRVATVDTLSGTVTTSSGDVFYKPPTTIATLIAKRSWLGEAYLDWSQFPLVTEVAGTEDGGAGRGELTRVTFQDLRFMDDLPLMAGRERTPLSGEVTINADRRVVGMEMDGRAQR